MENTLEIQLLTLNSESTLILDNYKKVYKECAIEMFIFNSIIIRTTLFEFNENLYHTLNDKYNAVLMQHLRAMDIEDYVSNFGEFINNRLNFYLSEVNNMSSPTWLPSKIYNLFYVCPLISKVEIPKSVDLSELIKFRIVLTELINKLKVETKLICYSY